MTNIHKFLSQITQFAGFAKKYPAELRVIKLMTNYLPNNASIRQRIWHILNNTSRIPVCSAPMCDNRVKWHHVKKKYNDCCSVKCANNQKSKIAQIKKTTLERYGAESFSRTALYILMRNNSNQERHGTIFPNSLPHIQDKRIATLKKNYGVTVPLHNENIKQKANQTKLDKYGTTVLMSLPVFKEKSKKTKQARFGRDNNTQQHIPIKNLEKLNDPSWLYNQHITNKRSCVSIGSELGVYNTTIHGYLKRAKIETCNYFSSAPEIEITDFLQQDNDILILKNNRKIIPPYELDIYLPNYNLAIEYCGLYWHADIHKRITKNYHKEKMDRCSAKGIQLLTIFEDEWNFKKDIIKRKLLYLINKSVNNVFARKTSVVKLNIQQKRNFFEANHIQGNGPGSIVYGLVSGIEIIAAMAFIKNKNGVYILNRYATSCVVPGGFTKLLTHFERNHKWDELVTFADRRWSEGSLYEQCGFVKDKQLPPDYTYVVNGKRIHKFNFRHKSLKTKLSNYDNTLSERINCFNHGLYRVWDCGKIRYVKTNSN